MHVQIRITLTARNATRTAKFDARAMDVHAHGALLLSYGAIPVVLELSDSEGISAIERFRLSR